jgi:multisubunit Na+/H+ antiporter MnhC subunit
LITGLVVSFCATALAVSLLLRQHQVAGTASVASEPATSEATRDA